MPGPVTISYRDLLKDDCSPLHQDISAAFGSSKDALGIILVSDLPEEWPKLRENAMRAAARFASLPESVREKYTDPDSSYSFGWSHGKEIMNGRPDTMKGSFYANPTTDHPQASDDQRKQHPTYLRDNIWPSEQDCPGYKEAHKALSEFMTGVGLRLAKACDQLVAQYTSTSSIETMIRQSQCSKARLLHYYPVPGQVVRSDEKSSPNGHAGSKRADSDDYCGDHLDHSLLTALCPAMYLFHPDEPSADSQPAIAVPAPTADAGLFIRSRNGKTVKTAIPADCMAFQTGEALQLLSRGKLQATPHYVSAGTGSSVLPQVHEAIEAYKRHHPEYKDVTSGTISRETMAVFLQPSVDDVIGGDARGQKAETFGQFTRRIIAEHYSESG